MGETDELGDTGRGGVGQYKVVRVVLGGMTIT